MSITAVEGVKDGHLSLRDVYRYDETSDKHHAVKEEVAA